MSIYMTADELEATADLIRHCNHEQDQAVLSYVVDVYDLGENFLGTVQQCDVGNYVFFAEPETD